jgi:hypothetical protein
MKKFALVAAGKVQNIVVAESEDLIGPETAMYAAVDITDVVLAPSVGWTYNLKEKTFAPELPKGLPVWEELVAQTAAEEEAAPAAKASSKKKSSDETPAEE